VNTKLPSKEELEAMGRIMEGLSYYQILKISTLASDNDIRDAFHREAYLYHPDRFFGMNDAEVLASSKKVYGKIVEAYRTLTSRTKREDYDKSLRGSELLSSVEKSIENAPIAESRDLNEITAVRKKEKGATVNSAMRFLKMAQSAFSMGDLNSAKMNIQIALNADPTDPDINYLNQKILAEVSRKSKSSK